MRSTRAQVARLAGVSPSVVSYVLNDGPRKVAAETRKRVEAAIASLEYRPNAIAQALRGGRSGVIGVIVRDASDALFLGLLGPLQRAASANGYALHFSFADNESVEKSNVESFVDRQVDALIAIEPVGFSRLNEVRQDGLPVAVVSRSAPRPDFGWVQVDYASSLQLVLDQAASSRADLIMMSRSAVEPSTSLRSPREAKLVYFDTDTKQARASFVEELQQMEVDNRAAVICSGTSQAMQLAWLLESHSVVSKPSLFYSAGFDLASTVPELFWTPAWDLDRVSRSLISHLILAVDAMAQPFVQVLAAEIPEPSQTRMNFPSWSVSDL